jgi:hypothetical protein
MDLTYRAEIAEVSRRELARHGDAVAHLLRDVESRIGQEARELRSKPSRIRSAIELEGKRSEELMWTGVMALIVAGTVLTMLAVVILRQT